MSLVSDLKRFLHIEYDSMKTALPREGFSIVYGDQYTPEKLRKAIIDQTPAVLKVGGIPMLAIGEDANGIFLDNGTNKIYKDDDSLSREWGGDAIVVKEKIRVSAAPARPMDMVILTPDLDTWSSEWMLKRAEAMDRIMLVNTLPAEALPTHPVILTFTAPGEKEKTEGIRGMTFGAQVSIYDPVDIVTIFYHELGHVYWATRMTKEEREQAEEIHKKCDGNFPPMFAAKSWHATAEEMFATLYMWFLKSKLVNPGYGQIACHQFHPGWELMESIYRRNCERVRQEQGFGDQEAEVADYVRNMSGDAGAVVVIPGAQKYFRKARRVLPEMGNVSLPESVKRDDITEHDGRKWVLIKSGKLAGLMVVLSGESIDLAYMRSNPMALKRVPRVVLAKAGNGTRYKRLTWVTPDELKKAAADPRKEQVQQYRFGSIRNKAKELTTMLRRHIEKFHPDNNRVQAVLSEAENADVHGCMRELKAVIDKMDNLVTGMQKAVDVRHPGTGVVDSFIRNWNNLRIDAFSRDVKAKWSELFTEYQQE